MKTFFRDNIVFIAICILIIILFTMYVSLAPLHADDYTYNFYVPNNKLKIYHEIPLIHYYSDNFAGVSRFIPHLIIGFFHYVEKPYYDMIAGLLFLLLGFLIAKLSTDKNEKLLPITLIACGLLFFVIRGFWQTSVWLSGVPNYEIPAIMVIIFIIVLRSDKPIVKNKILNLLLLFFLGLITGWTNEGFIIGLAIACVISYGLIYKNLTIERKILIGSLLIGCCFLCLSPYNISKFLVSHQSKHTSFYGLICQIISLGTIFCTKLRLTKVFVLSLSGIIIISYLKKRGGSKFMVNSWIKENIVIILSWIISLIFVLCTLYDSDRSRFPIEFYSLLLVCSLITKCPNRILEFTGSVSGISMILALIFILPIAKNNYLAYKDIENQMTENRLVITYKDIELSQFESRYIRTPSTCFNHPMLQSEQINKYYHNQSNSFIISEEIYNSLKSNNKPWEIYHSNKWKMSYIKIPEDKKVETVKFILSKRDFDNISIHLEKYGSIEDKLLFIENSNQKSLEVYIDGEKWLKIFDNKFLQNNVNYKIKVIVKSIEAYDDELFLNTSNLVPTKIEIVENNVSNNHEDS